MRLIYILVILLFLFSFFLSFFYRIQDLSHLRKSFYILPLQSFKIVNLKFREALVLNGKPTLLVSWRSIIMKWLLLCATLSFPDRTQLWFDTAGTWAAVPERRLEELNLFVLVPLPGAQGHWDSAISLLDHYTTWWSDFPLFTDTLPNSDTEG